MPAGKNDCPREAEGAETKREEKSGRLPRKSVLTCGKDVAVTMWIEDDAPRFDVVRLPGGERRKVAAARLSGRKDATN